MVSALLLPTLLAITIPQQASVQSAQISDAPDVQMHQVATYPLDSQTGNDVCFKLRVYLFQRYDDAAPTFVRETTCTTARPYLHRTRKAPKARLIPAN